MKMRAELGATCPNCHAGPGRPCTQPTDTGRRDVGWFHTSRTDVLEEAR